MSEISQAVPTLQNIRIDQISASPHQARKDFNEEAIKGLADSMKQEGLIEPIVVRQIGKDYELISGERRLRAAKMLEWTSIEAKVIQTTSEAEAAVKGLIENLQREDLNPIEEAEGFQELQNLHDANWTQKRISEVIGRNEVYVSKSLSLLRLPESLLEEFRQRKLSREHGIELLRINNANSQKGIANKIIKGDWSAKKTREYIDRKLRSAPNPAPQKGETSKVADPLAELWPELKAKSSELSITAWEVAYPEAKHYRFDVYVSEQNSKGELVAWFVHLAEALTGKVPAAQKSPVAPSTAEEILRGLNAPVRAPKNAAERSELEALAEQSPTAAYGWIYGSQDDTVRLVEGKSWKDLGFPSAKEGLAQLLSMIS